MRSCEDEHWINADLPVSKTDGRTLRSSFRSPFTYHSPPSTWPSTPGTRDCNGILDSRFECYFATDRPDCSVITRLIRIKINSLRKVSHFHKRGANRKQNQEDNRCGCNHSSYSNQTSYRNAQSYAVRDRPL